MRKQDEDFLNELVPDNQMLAAEYAKVAGWQNVRFVVTPGHGYLEVDDTPENRQFFTDFDYERYGKLYLEEDEDAGKWLDAHGIADFKEIPTVYAEDDKRLMFLIPGYERGAARKTADEEIVSQEGGQYIGSYGHELVIDSLRDTMAHCTCGGWEYVSPAFDRDSDEEIRSRIDEQFKMHTDWQNRKGSKTVPKRGWHEKGYAQMVDELVPDSEVKTAQDDDFFDTPRGMSDADIEMGQLEELGRTADELRHKGICPHGWYFTDPNGDGTTVCQHCGKSWPSKEEAYAEEDRLLKGGKKTAQGSQLDVLRELAKKEYPSADESDVEAAIYWYATDNHSGQGSDLYALLSTLPYKPDMARSIEDEGDMAMAIYEYFEWKGVGGKGKQAVLKGVAKKTAQDWLDTSCPDCGGDSSPIGDRWYKCNQCGVEFDPKLKIDIPSPKDIEDASGGKQAAKKTGQDAEHMYAATCPECGADAPWSGNRDWYECPQCGTHFDPKLDATIFPETVQDIEESRPSWVPGSPWASKGAISFGVDLGNCYNCESFGQLHDGPDAGCTNPESDYYGDVPPTLRCPLYSQGDVDWRDDADFGHLSGAEAGKRAAQSKWSLEDKDGGKFLVNMETGESEDVTDEYADLAGKGSFVNSGDDEVLSYLLMRRNKSMEGPLTAKHAGKRLVVGEASSFKLQEHGDGTYDVLDDQGNVVLLQESYQVASNFVEGQGGGEYSETDEMRDTWSEGDDKDRRVS